MPKYVEDQEVAKHHKKAKKQNKRSDHKHVYRHLNALIPSPILSNNEMCPAVIIYCTVCGKVKDVKCFWFGADTPPARENCILLDDFELFKTKYIALELINE